jgi:nucleotide-binding universal stress UspA family protein
MKRILIATDGSEPACEAVDFGIELAAEEDASVIFVHVAPAYDLVPMQAFGMSAATPHVPHVLDEIDRVALEGAEERAASQGVRATSKLLVGDAADEIVAYADDQSVDLIVIGSRGHGALASALIGSVSRAVLSQSKLPVTIVRARTAVGAEH